MGLSYSMSLMVGLLWFLFSEGLLLCMAQVVHNFTFDVKDHTYRRMCSDQSLLTVNDMFPGPNITVRRGDTANITVRNLGTHGLTIHWHGVKQPQNPWSDGPENITQTPIEPEKTFIYEVIFSDEEGTLWWHAHSDWSRASVYGAIIILPPIDTLYPFEPQPDYNETIILGSWFKDRDLMAEYLEAQRIGGDITKSDSLTINGWTGRLDINCPFDLPDIYSLKVERNKIYQLRIINAVMNEEMFFAIASHSFTVVGLDGAYIKPITTNYIMITPGQTMDILLTANQTAGKYYMGSSAFGDSGAPYDESTTRAIIEYSDYNGSPVVDLPEGLLPERRNKSAADAFTSQIKSLNSRGFPVKVPKDTDINRKIIMTISVNRVPCNLPPGEDCALDGGINRRAASLNNITLVTKPIDILRAFYCGIDGVFTEDFPNKPSDFDYTGETGTSETTPTVGTRVISLQYGDAVEIVFQGTNVGNAENHPMHVHGFNFYLVGSQDGNFNSSSPATYNLEDPAEVNTFGVPKNGWLAIRFWANNTGVWFLHCHLERHASWGMAGIIIVKNVTAEHPGLRPPPAGYLACPT